MTGICCLGSAVNCTHLIVAARTIGGPTHSMAARASGGLPRQARTRLLAHRKSPGSFPTSPAKARAAPRVFCSHPMGIRLLYGSMPALIKKLMQSLAIYDLATGTTQQVKLWATDQNANRTCDFAHKAILYPHSRLIAQTHESRIIVFAHDAQWRQLVNLNNGSTKYVAGLDLVSPGSESTSMPQATTCPWFLRHYRTGRSTTFLHLGSFPRNGSS